MKPAQRGLVIWGQSTCSPELSEEELVFVHFSALSGSLLLSLSVCLSVCLSRAQFLYPISFLCVYGSDLKAEICDVEDLSSKDQLLAAAQNPGEQ